MTVSTYKTEEVVQFGYFASLQAMEEWRIERMGVNNDES